MLYYMAVSHTYLSILVMMTRPVVVAMLAGAERSREKSNFQRFIDFSII